jgi:DNA-binding phage protein
VTLPLTASHAAGTVLAALFEGRPEGAMLHAAAFAGAPTARWSDRQQLLQRLATMRPAVLLLPPYDRHGLPSAPLIERCRREVPETVVAMVIVDAATAGEQIVRTLRAGAVVLRVASAGELRTALSPFLGAPTLSTAELGRMDPWLDVLGVRAAMGVQVLRAGLRSASIRSRHDALVDIARACRVSRRTLSRRLRKAGGPPLGELLVWIRLLRAALIAERGTASRAAIARAAGFATSVAYRRALATHCAPAASTHLSVVVKALERRLR